MTHLSRTLVIATVLLLGVPAAHAVADPRPRPPMNAAQIRLALDRLDVVGTALMVAAHPDDENTAMLAWLANGRKVRTVYLSVTRGDGGQNLIGPETGSPLGVIRTQELLAARRIDGAEQRFTSALDFGFSKSTDEALALWGKERTLADVVWTIRSLRPDLIVTRFTPTVGGHGHHTASAVLAEEAFDAAADPKRFPEQLDRVKPWHAKRLVWNASWPASAGPDTTPGRLVMDLGAYDPLIGRSYTEIAGESRSMHKSQGFGAMERRGTVSASFEVRRGDPMTRDLFEGVDLSWKRIAGSEAVVRALAEARRAWDPEKPHLMLPALAKAYRACAALPDEPIVRHKQDEIAELMRGAAGLWLEAIASAPTVSPGGTLKIATLALDRSPAAITLESLEVQPGSAPRTLALALPPNQPVVDTVQVTVGAARAPSQPYWLVAPPTAGAFQIDAAARTGMPENAPAFTARFVVRIAGERVVYDVPVAYRSVDRVKGERYRDVAIVPPATMRFEEDMYVFPMPGAASRTMRVTVEGADRPVQGLLALELPAGWSATPATHAIRLARAGQDTTVAFEVMPGAGRTAAPLRARLTVGERPWTQRRVTIDYDHVPIQLVFPDAEARLVRDTIACTAREVGYLEGSGDAIPQALRALGARVTMLTDTDVERADLSRYDAIVAGIRAYNTRPRLSQLEPRLLDYVANGGRLVVQYNTSETGLGEGLGPYPFTIARDRVTVEDAPVTITNPAHPLVTRPNRIAARDFDGWVQERGIYFAAPIDPRYDTILSMHDPGEPALPGSLIAAPHGRGLFVYTGLVLFREIPAGVPGAFRLLANLVSPR